MADSGGRSRSACVIALARAGSAARRAWIDPAASANRTPPVTAKFSSLHGSAETGVKLVITVRPVGRRPASGNESTMTLGVRAASSPSTSLVQGVDEPLLPAP